jgi:hypothetical protein
MTQGTIFTCAVAEEYPGCTVHGLIITARCDISNDKVQTVNYVPVVTLDDWLRRDGRLTVSQRFMKETLGKIKSALTESGYSLSILETESPVSLLDSLFAGGNARADKARLRFEALCARYDLAAVGNSNDAPSDICGRIAKFAPHLRDSLINELAHQKLAGQYFLNQLEPDGDDLGHVALLREIQALPRPVAYAIADGLDANRFAEMCSVEPRLEGRLRIETDGLALPLSIVKSPNVEHLMQSFSLLFSRIGIPDPDESYLETLWTRQPSLGEG